MATPLPIANGFYLSDSPIVSAQQCVNFYPNIVQAPGLSQETLVGTAGIRQLATTGIVGQENRGSIVMAGVHYFVNGNALYRLNRILGNPDTFTATNLGAITGIGRVSMATNGAQLIVLVPGGIGSLWDGSTFTSDINAVDSSFTANGAPQIVVFVDGYFLFTTDSKRFIISSLNDGLSYNALDFGSAESDPDDIVGVVVYKNQVFIMGTVTTEGFENIGGSGFPFQRNGVLDDTGLLARFSVVNGDDSFRFVGAGKNEGPGIYESRGGQAVKISNTAIDSILQDLTDAEISNIFAMHYGQNGQFFTSFTTDGFNQSIEYNGLSQRWNQRRSYTGGADNAWRVASISSAYGELIVCDRIDGRIGVLDEDLYTEYGELIRRRVDTMPFANAGKSASISMLELTMEPGVGDDLTPDPQIVMSRSINGGKTFTSGLSRSIGKVGEYLKRTIWRRLGRASRYEMFRFEVSDAVKPTIVKLEVNSRGNR